MPRIVATSPALKRILDIAERVAAGGAKVLITGESGVGKDVLARFIHAHSPRRDARYVALNCAGFSETLLGQFRDAIEGAGGSAPNVFDHVSDSAFSSM